MKQILDIPPDQIKDPEIKRNYSKEGFEDLKKSIRSRGIINPLTVVKRGEKFFLTAGRRRLEAAKELQLPTVPCLIIEADHEQALATTLHENLYREDLNATDEAAILAYLSDTLHYSNKRIAELISKSESYVSQRKDINNWPSYLHDALSSNKIGFAVARELAMIRNPKVQKEYTRFASEQGINYRTAKSWRMQADAQSQTAPTEHVESSETAPPALQTTILGRCSNCKKQVPIPELTAVYLCEECIQGKD